MEDGQVTQPERGTPQGSVTHPCWRTFISTLSSICGLCNGARGDMVMVRYADDTFLSFEHREEVERFLVELRERVAQFGLSLHPEKTRLIASGRHANAWCRCQGQRRAQTFDFLGFTHICGIIRGKGWFQLRRVTMAKRMHAKLAEIKQQFCLRLHGRMREVGAWLRKVLQGFYNYHACPAICADCGQCDIGCCTRGGASSAAAVSYACRGTATFRMFRRGCPNPECSIPLPTRAFAPPTRGGEPYAGNLQVRICAGGDG